MNPPAAAPRQRGWSLVETMVAIAIVATGLMVLVQQLSIGFRESNTNENRAFAYQKAAALLGEIDNSIVTGRLRTSDELYALADVAPNPVLTTRRDGEGLPFAPDHPMSGNYKRRDRWAWSRRLSVTPAENTGLYYCRVEVLHLDDNDIWRSEAAQAVEFSLLPSTESPAQVHDVYLLACNETPSLWADQADLRAHFESAQNVVFGQSQAEVRLHWITRLGYGRDPCYAPFVNTAIAADQRAPACYWLPGLLGGDHANTLLYRAELLAGLHRTEAGLVNGFSPAMPVPSTIADQFNNCLRTPAAWRLFTQRVAAGLEHADEPPLQLLLDDMTRRPEAYRNAIVVNLHGRGLPVPPLRNYSDAAKDPVGRPGVRVVTHPSRLWTPRDPNGDGNPSDAQTVELRVYGYRTEPGAAVLDEPVLVQIFGPDLTAAVNDASVPTLLVDRLAGGVDTTTGAPSAAADYQPFATAPQTGSAPREMWFEVGFTPCAQPYTWLRLHNTPLVAPAVGTRGLQPESRLYGFDYVPSPVTGSFAQDLATDSSALIVRNTARWRIRIPARAFTSGALPNADVALRVATRIGTNYATGQRWPTPVQPLNLSETWTWWTRQSSAVPVTERAQFLGDPRLCPYEDLMAAGASFPHGYNWNFDDLLQPLADARPLWPCFQASRLRDGFAQGPRADAPRLLQLLRNALQSAGCVFVAPVDRLAHTLLLGGEIALPTAAGTTGIALHQDFGAGALPSVDTIDPAATGGIVLQRGFPATWYHKPWLGELFPDDLGAAWVADGNLPLLGAGDLRWHKWQGDSLPVLPYGTVFSSPIGSVMGVHGGALFVDYGVGRSAFTVADLPLVGMQRPGAAIESINRATNLVPPGSLTGARAVSVTATYANAPPAFTQLDSFPRSTLTFVQLPWDVGGVATALIGAWAGPSGTAMLAPWTTEPSPTTASEVALQSLLLGIRALHVGGEPLLPNHIAQVPQLQIIEPTPGTSRLDPEAVLVRWQTLWLRFDGQPYTESYPTPYSQNESELCYRLLLSHDNGAGWTSAVTGHAAVPGAWPDDGDELLADVGTGNESFTIALPATLPAGEYIVRVEAWRTTAHVHCASHEVRIFVRRSL